jgi:hypothetical protein
MTDQSTRKRGRPRTKPAGEVHVSVPIPQWLLEHIDVIGPNRGRTVARLFMEQLARTTHTEGLSRKLEDILYG